MALYNYKQFEEAARKAGLYDQFSESDLLIAQKNPDAGMSLLKYKQDWGSATTDAARALANEGAERIRSEYGGYTGGSDGSGFSVNSPSPSSFTYETAPAYANKYEAEADKLMQEILNRGTFSYNPDADPLYSSYKKQYAREGKRATEDTLGSAAAATGGIPSSYAVTAASQAGNYYAAQAADKIPELEELAYQKYLSELQMKQADIGMVQDAEEREYQRYLDALSKHNADRNFAYGQYLDELSAKENEREAALEKAVLAGEYGDTSYLKNMGITPDTSDKDFERQYILAELAAQYGDTSYLEAMGITPTTSSGTGEADFLKQLELAQKMKDLGDSSYLEALGIDTMRDEREAAFKDVRALYPDGALDDAAWNDLVARYGEEAVRAAGFTRMEDGIGPIGDTGGNYENVLLHLNAMHADGATKAEIREALDNAYASGFITKDEYEKLKR